MQRALEASGHQIERFFVQRMVTGGVVGSMVNPSLGILGIEGGGVIGALIGSFIGFLMRRKTKAKIPKKVKGESNPSENSL